MTSSYMTLVSNTIPRLLNFPLYVGVQAGIFSHDEHQIKKSKHIGCACTITMDMTFDVL